MDYKTVLLNCGWDVNREEPPLIAERVAKHAADRIEELEALTKADGKEIGSYRKGTGLRGENKRLQKMLDEVEAENQRLREALELITRECDALNKGPVATEIARKALEKTKAEN